MIGKSSAPGDEKACHFDERSEEKSYSDASLKLKVSSLKNNQKHPNPNGNYRISRCARNDTGGWSK